MSDFTLSNGAGGIALPKARALPIGTKVRIVDAGVFKSNFKRTIRGGRNAGKEMDLLQLRVTYQALEAGTTIPYEVRKTGAPAQTVPAAKFAAGDLFAQYFGGVYPKDEGGYTFTEAAGAAGFVTALKEAGVPPTGRLADYNGLEVSINHIMGRGPGGPWCQAVPGKVLGIPPAQAAPSQASVPTQAPTAHGSSQSNAAPVPASVAQVNAFAALSSADQKAILETLQGGYVLSAKELVEAGMAKDEAHAASILAATPKSVENPLLVKKAA